MSLSRMPDDGILGPRACVEACTHARAHARALGGTGGTARTLPPATARKAEQGFAATARMLPQRPARSPAGTARTVKRLIDRASLR
jgi:hypothetical protein